MIDSRNSGMRPAMALLTIAIGLAACSGSGAKQEASYPDRRSGASDITYSNQPRETIWGDGSGMWLFGSSGRPNDGSGQGGGGIGVNTFLWRASLDTLSFMPMNQVDPFGGVIITDWYSSPGAPDERMKVNIYILDRTLRADGVRVAVFRQRRDANGNWADAPVEPKTNVELEDAILTRARQMRLGMAAQ